MASKTIPTGAAWSLEIKRECIERLWDELEETTDAEVQVHVVIPRKGVLRRVWERIRCWWVGCYAPPEENGA